MLKSRNSDKVYQILALYTCCIKLGFESNIRVVDFKEDTAHHVFSLNVGNLLIHVFYSLVDA